MLVLTIREGFARVMTLGHFVYATKEPLNGLVAERASSAEFALPDGTCGTARRNRITVPD